jgi:hypothetical protein
VGGVGRMVNVAACVMGFWGSGDGKKRLSMSLNGLSGCGEYRPSGFLRLRSGQALRLRYASLRMTSLGWWES